MIKQGSIIHPFLQLSRPDLRKSALFLLFGFSVLTVIFAIAVPAKDMAAVARLVQAGSEHAQEILDNWGQETRESFRFMLGFDFLYDLTHNNMVAVFVVWGAVRTGKPRLLAIASICAWILWLDSGLNVVENLAYNHMLSQDRITDWHPVASSIFTFRTTTLMAAAGFALFTHALAFRYRQHH